MGETSLLMPEEGTLAGQFEDLRRRATKDALSGLLNRATMEQYIKDRLRAMAPGETCALFIVDLDDFKQVNDTLGHLAGDQAIRKAGQILSGLFRANDIVGRLGGDEFAAFLCGCVTEEMVRDKAAAICEQLHLALGDRTVVNLTASAGAYLAGRGQSFEGLYQTADLALYKAKKAGKNRFCLKSRDGYREVRSEEYRPVNTIPLSGLLQEMDSAVALLELGPLLQVIYVSPSYCRIIGVDSKDFPLPAPLARLIHPDDLAALDHALREGQRQGQAVEHTHRISGDGGDTWHWWHIRATQVAYDNPHPVMLITAMDVSLFKETERRQAERIQAFQVSQRDLRATIQHLETVNGELQAANEELLTANEELQSSTEALQSVNEELCTVNTEHQLKLDELATMTNDLSSFLSSTMIGIIFVDSSLNIRKFTEYVGREFHLMDHDVGRSIQIFAHSFPDEAIEADCKTVLRDLISIDREVTAMNGRFYTLRIAPYRTTENNIRGLVITIIDSLGSGQGSPVLPGGEQGAERGEPLPLRQG